jgi:PAS domain S-box-containing protein
MTIHDINPSVTPKAWKAAWETVRNGASGILETTQRRKDGTVRHVDVARTIVSFEGRELLFSAARDTTERKAAEAALRLSEDKFSRAFHASPDAINITRLEDGTYLDVSQGFERITGWTREEAIGRTALELNIWADPGDRQQAVALLRSQGGYTDLEFPFFRKAGGLLTGLMSGKVIEVDGTPCLLSVTRDITAWKSTEAALRTAEQRLRTVLANSQAIIYQLDPEGRFLLSEGLGLANLGLKPGEAVGRTPAGSPMQRVASSTTS